MRVRIFITFFALALSVSFVAGCDDVSKDVSSDMKKTNSEDKEKLDTEEASNDDSDFYYQGDSFSLYKIEGEDKGAELQYVVTKTAIMTSATKDDYMFVEVDITNKSDREQTIEAPGFYADDYLITEENPAIPDDATPPNTTIKPGKKVTARFYQYITHPYEHKKLEANFGNASVIIVGGNLVFTNNNGEVFYEKGKLVGDRYGICGKFQGFFYYGEEPTGDYLEVEMSSPDVYHIKLDLRDGTTVDGEANIEFNEQSVYEPTLHLRKEHLYSLFYNEDEKQYTIMHQNSTWFFKKISDDIYNSAVNKKDNNVVSSDRSELLDTIIGYYINLHGDINVDGEISSETSDGVVVRLFSPYDTSDTLGTYKYNKSEDYWTDMTTGDPVDFDEVAGAYEELLNGRSGYTEYILPHSSDQSLTEADLEGLSAQDLTYARNEIYARHGYIFKSAELSSYFNSKGWYYPDSSFDGKLSGVEKKNTEFISEYQNKYGLTYKPD